MTKTCEFCKAEDLHDDARKCRYCGSWLVGSAPDQGPVEALRKELKEEHAAFRGYLEGLLTRLSWAAGVIVALALAATAYFGVRTDQNISASTERIERESRSRIEAAAAEATENARLAMIDKLNSAETQARIEAALQEEIDRLKGDVEQRLVEARGALDQTLAQVTQLRTAFADARGQTLEMSPSRLPLDRVRAAEKEGLGELELMREARVEALSFVLGDFYDGPMVWKYFDTLLGSAQFRHVILLEPDGTVFGLADAGALAAQLNPPDHVFLRASFGGDPYAVPDEAAVPGWAAFAEMLGRGDRDRLAELPMFVAGAYAVPLAASSVDALEAMESLGVDRLPVVDSEHRFAGVVERGRLATRVLLELAPPGL